MALLKPLAITAAAAVGGAAALWYHRRAPDAAADEPEPCGNLLSTLRAARLPGDVEDAVLEVAAAGGKPHTAAALVRALKDLFGIAPPPPDDVRAQVAATVAAHGAAGRARELLAACEVGARDLDGADSELIEKSIADALFNVDVRVGAA